MAACGFLATDSPENQTDAVFVCMPSANPGGVKVSDFSRKPRRCRLPRTATPTRTSLRLSPDVTVHGCRRSPKLRTGTSTPCGQTSFIAPPYLVPIYSDPKYFGPHVGPGHGIPGSMRHHTGLVALTIASWLRRSKATVRSNSRHSADDVDEQRRAISPTSIRLIRSRTSSRKRGGVLLLLPDDPWAIR